MGKRGLIGLAAVGVAAIGGAATVALPSARAAYPGRSGLIAFAAGRGAGEGETQHGVWLVSATGGDLHRVPGIPNSTMDYSVSPSGRQIAFIAESEHGAGPETLKIVTLKSGAVRTLMTAPKLEEEAWSPSGRQLAVDDGEAIVVMSTSATDRKTLCHGCFGRIAWSTRGVIAYASPRGPIFTIPATGGTPHQLTQPGGTRDLSEDWSPDGQTLVFDRPSGAADNIFSVNAGGGDLQQLTHATAPNLDADDPAYSPNGAEIAYDVEDGNRLWVMHADGSDAHAVRTPGLHPSLPDWTTIP